MSFDPPEVNQRFRNKEDFPYRLLSDVDQSVGEVYHAVRPPDDPFPGVPRRISYLIDPDGTVAAAYEVEDRESHAQDVLQDLLHLVTAP